MDKLKVRNAFVTGGFAVLALVGVLLSCANSGTPDPNAPPPDASSGAPAVDCSPEGLAKIEAAYVAEVVAACPKGTPKEECPAWPEIRDRTEKKREEWNRCRSPKQ